MTTRRQLLAAAGLTALAGCSARSRPAAAPAAVPDVLLADARQGLVVVRGARSDVVGAAVASPDASTIYATVPAPDGATWLKTIATATGAVNASVRLDGAWVPRLASVGGNLVALMPPATGQAGARGRTSTGILVAGETGARFRLKLAGNLDPDAFGRAGDRLFVLDWLPPAAPDRYRVRAVDLTSGVPGPLLTRDKQLVPPGAEEEMHGQARQAVYAPNMSTVYTLYTNQPDHQHTRDLLAGRHREGTPAFVHTLNLDLGWAYCVDLPEPFGRGAPDAHTVAVTPSGGTLLVADFAGGHLAAIDTDSLTVARVVALPTAAGLASATAAPDSARLYLATAGRVCTVDLRTLKVVAEWDAGEPVRGMATSRDGSRVLTGHSGAIAWWDAATGRRLGRLPVAGLTQLRCVV